MIEIFDCPQNSAEWFEVRRGIPTASEFSSILAKGEGKTRASYMRKLAAEIVTGECGESFMSPAMERGHAMENEARQFYAFITDYEPELVGFIRNGNKGGSPDSLIGKDGLLEIKTMRGDLLIELIIKDEFPSAHKAQCQGNLWISEREWVDISVYWPKMPPFIQRAYRDETYIKTLVAEVDRFNGELAALVDRIRAYGDARAA